MAYSDYILIFRPTMDHKSRKNRYIVTADFVRGVKDETIYRLLSYICPLSDYAFSLLFCG